MPQPKLISPISKQALPKTRVAAYCRVSSSSTDQLNSCDMQITTYRRMIRGNSQWELVDIFADEGISGTKTDNRAEFQRMIRMCEQHQIDLIITKSVSRFARNVKEALDYVRKLKLLGIGVQFEKEGIYTLALGDEMLLNVFSAIAQEESKSISQNQRLSIRKRMEAGDYVDSNAPYGFRLSEKKLMPHEQEAETVRAIFESYLNGQSTSEIARELNAKGITTKSGKTHWRSTTVSYMLKNERYVGDCRYQKTYRDEAVPFKQHKNRGNEDMFYATQTHTPIITREVFEQVQRLLTDQQLRFTKAEQLNTYPLTSHIRCSECGSFYRRKMRNGTAKWVCVNHFNDATACPSNYYDEQRIYDGFITMVNKLRFGEEQILAQLISTLESISDEYKKRNKAATMMSRSIAELNAKILMLDQLKTKGYLAADVHQSQVRDIRRQIEELKSKRKDAYTSPIKVMLNDVTKLQTLLMELDDPLESFDEALFRAIVKDISINRHDEMTVTLLGGLRFTELI